MTKFNVKLTVSKSFYVGCEISFDTDNNGLVRNEDILALKKNYVMVESLIYVLIERGLRKKKVFFPKMKELGLYVEKSDRKKKEKKNKKEKENEKEKSVVLSKKVSIPMPQITLAKKEENDKNDELDYEELIREVKETK